MLTCADLYPEGLASVQKVVKKIDDDFFLVSAQITDFYSSWA